MNWVTRILDYISPRLCVVCGERLAPTERSLCSVCLFHLPRTNFHLKPLDNPMAQLFWVLSPVEKAAALFYYHPHAEMAQMVYRLKYNNRPDIGEDMGRVMANELQQSDYFSDIDVLLPVPLSSKRLRQRGYNQSEMLARGVSDVTHLPVVTKALCRKEFHQRECCRHLSSCGRQPTERTPRAAHRRCLYHWRHPHRLCQCPQSRRRHPHQRPHPRLHKRLMPLLTTQTGLTYPVLR